MRDYKGATVLAGVRRINVVHDALSACPRHVFAALYAAIDHGLS